MMMVPRGVTGNMYIGNAPSDTTENRYSEEKSSIVHIVQCPQASLRLAVICLGLGFNLLYRAKDWLIFCYSTNTYFIPTSEKQDSNPVGICFMLALAQLWCPCSKLRELVSEGCYYSTTSKN